MVQFHVHYSVMTTESGNLSPASRPREAGLSGTWSVGVLSASLHTIVNWPREQLKYVHRYRALQPCLSKYAGSG
ncbi:unnamed protein product [Protopolystoma xenopodis]|uniref:Uncharacterized protein n=1 Tax=Protopolystoma xenopodis TaxID=117903 RepID=A0A448XMX5_9PLAT|nr:unnamed protein product [Protopolystoma xenopodis]